MTGRLPSPAGLPPQGGLRTFPLPEHAIRIHPADLDAFIPRRRQPNGQG